MSVLIKGMEMPKSCSVCRLFGEYGCPFIGAVGYALTRGERNEDCPLVPVPPHGRLIDAVEVVRCKDCRHRDPEDHKCDSGETERQGCPFKVADDYFCAYGER